MVRFKNRKDAELCALYARGRYPTVKVTEFDGGQSFPYGVECDPIGEENQLCVTFIKGFAYALGSASYVTEVRCKGDERARYAPSSAFDGIGRIRV